MTACPALARRWTGGMENVYWRQLSFAPTVIRLAFQTPPESVPPELTASPTFRSRNLITVVMFPSVYRNKVAEVVLSVTALPMYAFTWALPLNT